MVQIMKTIFSYDGFRVILNMSITAGIIIMAVLLVRRLLRKAPKIFSYALWGIVLFRLVCPISFSSPLSVLNLTKSSLNDVGEMQYLRQEPVSNHSLVMDNEVRYSQANHELATYPEYHGQALQEQNEKKNVLTNNQRERVWSVVISLWIVGIVILLGLNMVSLIRVRRKVAASINRKDNIFIVDDIDIPFCLGFVKPRIYLPSFLEEQEMGYIILHEQHHIRRGDQIIKLIAFLALCLHWFNPLVWIAFILSGRDMEMSCDEAVLRKIDRDIRADYSTSLIHVSTGRRIFTASSLAFGEGNPKQRIKNVMNYRKPGFWIVVVAVVICSVTVICLTTNPTSGQKAEKSKVENRVSEDDEIKHQKEKNTNSGNVTVNEGEESNGTTENPNTMVQELEDIDGNGQKETVIYTGCDGIYTNLSFFFNGEKVYERDGSDTVAADIGNLVAYEDIDHDGEKEIILTMDPHVDSMSLKEYAVLKNKNGTWEELEVYHDESITDNSFPISVTKGVKSYEAVISCLGVDTQITCNLETMFATYKKYYKAIGEEDSLRWIDSYEHEVLRIPEGQECGSTCAGGVCDLELGSYDGNPCLIASQGIHGYSKEDYWGELIIWFNYDQYGKIRILDLDMAYQVLMWPENYPSNTQGDL